MSGYTPHQRGIIRRFYDNREQLAFQNLAELVSQLYVAETDKEREKLWKRVATSLQSVELPKGQVEAILAKRDLAALAKALEKVF